MKVRVAPYLRLKRGGPPACADELQVRDRETGELVQDVIEADVSLRFVAVHARDGNGQLRFSDGKAVPERRSGDFQIEYKPESSPPEHTLGVLTYQSSDSCIDSVDRYLSMDAGAFVQELLRCAQELEEEVQRIREILARASK